MGSQWPQVPPNAQTQGLKAGLGQAHTLQTLWGPRAYSWLSWLICALENLTAVWKTPAASQPARLLCPLRWNGRGQGGEKMPFAQLLGHGDRGTGRGSVLSVFSPKP